MNKKFSPPDSPLLLVKIRVELHEGTQESLKSNNNNVSDELLIVASQKYEEDQGWYLKDDNENHESNEILLLASQKVENSIQVIESCYSE